MSMLIAAFVCIALMAISVAHLAWSLGLSWPLKNRKLLAQTVVGFTGVEKMPNPLFTFVVAIATFYAAFIALAMADPEGGGTNLNLVGGVIALIFLARGIIGYTGKWQAMTSEPIFRFNDKRVYSPLCLFIGLGFTTLILLRLF